MTKPATLPTDSESLKRSLHDRIEQLKERELALLNRVALQLEAEELARDLDEAFDADRRAGRLTRERVEQVIAEVRARHGRAP
jgi:FixJ family two-component response regulator